MSKKRRVIRDAVLLSSAKSHCGKCEILAMRPGGATLDELNELTTVADKHLKRIHKEHYGVLRIEAGRYYLSAMPFDGLLTQQDIVDFDQTTQVILNGEIPTKEDFESAYRTLTRPSETISIDLVLDQIEITAKKKGLSLKNNWRMITEKNIEEWSKKR